MRGKTFYIFRRFSISIYLLFKDFFEFFYFKKYKINIFLDIFIILC